MKILAVNVLYYPDVGGGVEISIKHLYEGLVKKGHEVYVLAFTDEKKSIKYEVNGVNVIKLKKTNLYIKNPFKTSKVNLLKKIIWHILNFYNLKSKIIFLKTFKEINPDVVIFHNNYVWSPSILNLPEKYNIPSVHVLHDLNFICPKNMFKNNKRCDNLCFICRIYKLPYKIFSKKITAVVGVSKFILELAIKNKYFRNSKIKTFIYNSRNFKKINIDNRKDCKEIVFGFIGSISKIKGIEIALKAFNKIYNENLFFYIAGSGEDTYLNYLKINYSNRNIKYLGFVEPKDFYSQIDVLIVPSIWYEPLGLVIKEANFYGKPVIASNIGGIPELIIENKNGLLFNVDDVEDLEKKMFEFKNNIIYWRSLSEEIKTEAIKFFDYDNWIEKWDSILKNLIKF